MSEPMSAQITETLLGLAKAILPIFVGGAFTILLITLGCLWELCRQTRRQEDRRAFTPDQAAPSATRGTTFEAR